MAKVKSTKKATAKKVVYKKGPSKGQIKKTKRSKVVSFLVGVVTVGAIAYTIFQYSQTNNYKQVLGNHTQSEQNSSK